MTSIYTWTAILLGSALLAGCGGEGETSNIERNGDGGLFFGLYQSASTGTSPRNLGGLYLNVPSSNGDYFGQVSFQFDPLCQLVNNLPILGDKLGSGLSGAAGGKLDNPIIPSTSDDVVFSMPASYFFDGRSYGGNYTRLEVTANQPRRTSLCNTEYNLAPNGAWVTHIQGTRFPADLDLRQTSSNQITWLSPDSGNSTRALIMLLDADILKKPKAPERLPENAIVSQVVQAIPAKRPDQPNVLNTYNLVAQSTLPKNYIVVVQLLNSQGQLVGFDDLSVRF